MEIISQNNKDEKCDSYDFVKIKGLYSKGRGRYIVSITSSDEGLEDEYIFSEDTIVKHMVFKDKEFKVKEFKALLKETLIQIYTNKCINYLSYGPKTVHEMYQYLERKTSEDEKKSKKRVIKHSLNQTDYNSIIKELIKLEYLNDLEYAKSFAKHYMNDKGKTYIVNILSKKGVRSDIINEALADFDFESEELVEEVVRKSQKYVDSIRKYPLRKQELMLSQKLQRDGFGYDIIEKVKNRISFNDESDETIDKDILKVKKRYEGKGLDSYQLKEKIISSLLSKGYEYNKIKEKLK